MTRRSYLADYGPRLLAQGYPIVPIRARAKHPGFAGWQKCHADEAKLKGWLSNGFACGGVGILTRDFPGVDLDVRDDKLVNKLVEWCEIHIGRTARRVGQPPKQLLVYRTDTPFTKIVSPTYADASGRKHKVEILGAGQQFVAYATHPDTGKPYEWVSQDALADIAARDLPTIDADKAQALIAYFTSIIPKDWTVVDHGRSGGAVDPSIPAEDAGLIHGKPPLADLPSEQLKKHLAYLNPDMGRDEWVLVGMALYHQYNGGEDGFALWDDWSAQGVKYKRSEMRRLWQSFKADLLTTDPITAAWVLKKAGQARKKNSPLGGFRERYVLIEHGNLVCDLKKPPYCAVSKLEEFRNATANIRHSVPAPTKSDPDREKLQPVHFAWLVDQNRKTAQGTCYDPAKPFFYQDERHDRLWWVNEFYLPEFDDGLGGDIAIFYEHMDYLFPVERERAWFIGWMAFNLQYPARRCKVTPLHVSLPHGTGRGFLIELMARLLGPWNCTKTKMSVLCGEGNGGGFHDYLNKSLFCAIEEVHESKRRYAVSDKTRDLLTENYLEVNVKHGVKRTQAVFTNFFFMTNHPDALVLGEEDRRINVFSGPEKARERSYYNRLYAWLDSGGVAALRRELTDRDLSDFDWQHSFDTPARRLMIENNQTETEILFHELMNAPPFPAMTFAQIVREMTKLSERDAFDTNIEEGQLRKLLQHHARHTGRTRFGGRNGLVRRVWVLDPEIAQDTQAIRKAVETCGLV